MPYVTDFFRKRKTQYGTSKRPDPVQTENIKEQASTETERIKKTEEVDDKIEEGKGKNPEHDKPAEFVKPTRSAIVDDENKGKLTKEQTLRKSETLMNYFARSITYQLTEETTTQVSEYVPNLLPLLILMTEANRLVGTSPHITKYHKNFLPYAATTGFVLIAYLHIIDCRKAAGVATGYEKSALKKFTDSFSMESIKLPNFIYHFIDSIVSTKNDDTKYSWIVPSMNNGTNDYAYKYDHAAGTSTYTDTNGLGLLLPNYPAMLAMIAEFGSLTNVQLTARMNERTFTPFDINDNQITEMFGLPAANLDFRVANHGTANSATYNFFNNCGVRTPFEFETDDYRVSRDFLAKSNFYGRSGVNFKATAAAFPNNIGITKRASIDFNRPDFFLNLGKDQSTDHVEFLLYHMNIFTKYWKSDFNMSDLRTRGGLEPTIVTYLKTEAEVDPTNNRHSYPNIYMDQPTVGDIRWSDLTSRADRNVMTANFGCTKAGITRYNELLAMTFATVAIPPIHGYNRAHILRRGYYADMGQNNLKFSLGQETDDEGAKPMYRGFTTEVLMDDLIQKGGE